ncbi:MAG: HAD family hydrolase, partial [Candidatus Sericytochromatia bacterium]|nr:HAD family hydrolase [Candidatus Sericytochromatia bacterium]
MRRAHLLFDLDGTLVDSCEGIAVSLRAALRTCGLAAQPEVGREMVGPPLRELLAPWLPPGDAQLLARATEAFKAHYDEAGFLLAAPFDGVEAMLVALARAGIATSVVTNKRAAPARAIIDGLGWGRFFERIYALDSWNPVAPSKAEALSRVLKQYGLRADETWYVGDR